ncbi:SUMF1/EgtB/PvdO family nonheme iron enzyme [Vannielia litorea]|uniref:SUMF1/EgtB/PvdO family nonheme iron enzyme n=1 Tax=Vannielia litorea TaxID=1217970 RepID=UPI001FEA5A85|nr:SUMF1/EgtB/PvdO family nonheme iron enzyme [Vannielia litorea]
MRADAGPHLRDCVPVPGGKALLGTAHPLIEGDGEGPLVEKRVRDLWWERGATSIAQFRRFVDATGHVTEAERYGWSFVFHLHVPGGGEGTLGVEGLEWWRRIEGASWERPAGPDAPPGADDMPATHIAFEDARAFAAWAGGRLPREVEWEHAARGGLGDVRYPWGDDEPDDARFLPCNIWQGTFPNHDTGADGFAGPAPVHSFTPNGYGLHHVVGNVWEWTAEPFRLRSGRKAARALNAQARGRRLLKGGSFLCHRSYCHRYRIAARTGNTPDSSSSHTGFRVVYDTPPAH